jgi:hypothetical protein
MRKPYPTDPLSRLLPPKKRLPVAPLLPDEFPRWPTVYHYLRTWRIDGTWEIREVMCERRGVQICCDDSPHDVAVDPPLRAFHTVSLRSSMNKAIVRPLGVRRNHLWCDRGWLSDRQRLGKDLIHQPERRSHRGRYLGLANQGRRWGAFHRDARPRSSEGAWRSDDVRLFGRRRSDPARLTFARFRCSSGDTQQRGATLTQACLRLHRESPD